MNIDIDIDSFIKRLEEEGKPFVDIYDDVEKAEVKHVVEDLDDWYEIILYRKNGIKTTYRIIQVDGEIMVHEKVEEKE